MTAPLVHLIAAVDLDAGTGEILYVSPSNVAAPPGGAVTRTGPVSLILRDAAGGEIGRVVADLRRAACDRDAAPGAALVQEDVALRPDLAEIALAIGGRIVDVYRPAPPPETAAGAPEMGLGPPPRPGSARMGYAAAGVAAVSGVSYTVQARADSGGGWQTLSVGRPRPEFEIDRNQFPGAAAVELRVLRVAGFRQTVIDTRRLELD